MPACPRPGWLPIVFTALILGACERPAPPAAAAPGACLAQAAGPAPPLPWISLHARELAGAPLDSAGRSCVEAALGSTAFATPQAYDDAYAPLQAFHGEDAALRLDALKKTERGILVGLDSSGERGIWLLRIETGLEMEGGRYDVLFTTGADGRVRDTLLIGADGLQYRRDANLLHADRFAVLEQTGREDTRGPAYAAAFAIDRAGRIGLDASGTAELRAVMPDTAPAPATGEPSAPEAAYPSASSLEEVDGAPGDLDAVRRLLFRDATVVEASITRPDPRVGAQTVLALGGADIGGFVLYVLDPVEPQPTPGRTVYRVASLTVPEPPRVLGATVGTIGWRNTGEGALITLPIDYAFERPGGDPRTGEPASDTVPQLVRVRYAEGRLHPVDDRSDTP